MQENATQWAEFQKLFWTVRNRGNVKQNRPEQIKAFFLISTQGFDIYRLFLSSSK